MYQCSLQAQEHVHFDKRGCRLRLREYLLPIVSSLLIVAFSILSEPFQSCTATRKTFDLSLSSRDLNSCCENLITPADSILSLPLVELVPHLSNRIRFRLLMLADLGDCATCHCSIYLGSVSHHPVLDFLPPTCLIDQQICVEAAQRNSAFKSFCCLLLCSVLLAPRRLSLSTSQLLAP